MPDPRKVSMEEGLQDAFKEMTLLELSAFVKQFEETFDVKAAAPVAVAAAAPGVGAAAEAEGKDEFDVILEAAGDKKIQVIAQVRILTSLGLKEAKDLVDGAPKPLLNHVNMETADRAKAALERAGATTSVRRKRSRRRQLPGGATHRGRIRVPGSHAPECALIRELAAMLGGRVLAGKALDRPEPQITAWMSGEEFPPDDVVFSARALLEVGLTFNAIWDMSLYLDWLVTDNAHLWYARPIDVIAAGRADDVVNAIEAAAYGIYA